MMWMLRRGRKIPMLRRRMLRRKTDPKTGKHTLCEPAQSKCTWTLSQEAFFYGKSAVRQGTSAEPAQSKRPFQTRAFCFTGKMPTPAQCEPAQSKCTWTFHKRHFVQKFTGKCRTLSPAASVLCEPAQSKCTWTCHKRHFVQKFTGKMPDASDTTSIEHRPLITVRTPQCGHTVWGKKKRYQVRFCKLPLSRSR